jgi:hypothetical protein
MDVFAVCMPALVVMLQMQDTCHCSSHYWVLQSAVLLMHDRLSTSAAMACRMTGATRRTVMEVVRWKRMRRKRKRRFPLMDP